MSWHSGRRYLEPGSGTGSQRGAVTSRWLDGESLEQWWKLRTAGIGQIAGRQAGGLTAVACSFQAHPAGRQEVEG